MSMVPSLPNCSLDGRIKGFTVIGKLSFKLTIFELQIMLIVPMHCESAEQTKATCLDDRKIYSVRNQI